MGNLEKQMAVTCKEKMKQVDWDVLLAVFTAAPLGKMKCDDIRITFNNSAYN